MRYSADDDDLRVVGADEEPGRMGRPGSSHARRRAHLEDDGLSGPGVDDRPKKVRARRPTGLYEHWLRIVEPVMWESGVESSAQIARPVFNKHVADMRVDYTDDEIMAAFNRFAQHVRAGRITLVGKPAWFVFYARRRSMLIRERLVVEWTGDNRTLIAGVVDIPLGFDIE